MTFGFSRDDAGKFLASYYDNKIYESDPFSKLDQAGVGRLVKMAAELGRQTRRHHRRALNRTGLRLHHSQLH